MEDVFQVQAYSEADFSEPHDLLVGHLKSRLPDGFQPISILDLGAGSGDLSLRLKKAFPKARLTLVDGSAEMLRWNQEIWKKAGLVQANFIHSKIQDFRSEEKFDLIFSNSLLHHLADPYDLWECLQRSISDGTFVFVSDLLRPDSLEKAKEMSEKYCGNESSILKLDFCNSLQAAYTLGEIESMLNVIKWSERFKLERISDRHWISYGSWI